MRFSVSAEGVDFGGPLGPKEGVAYFENLVIPSFQMLEKWEKEGKMTGGRLAGQRAGCFIIEASSPEELSKMLSSLPFWGAVKWDVHPLTSVSSAIEQTREIVNRLKATASGMP